MKNISTTSFKKYCAFVAVLSFYLFAMLFNGATANAQITNLKFSSSTGNTYTDITGGTTLVAGGNVAIANAKSAVTDIGFTFKYQGVDYTQFSVAGTGQLQLGGTQILAYDNTNPTNEVAPKIFPFWDFFTVGNAASGGGITSLVSGTAPNRVLTVQWKVTGTPNGAVTHNFQAKLYETPNKIEFLYGAGTNIRQGTTAVTYAVGLNGVGKRNQLLIWTPTEAFTSNTDFDNSVWPGNGKKYIFTPSTPSTQNNKLVGTNPKFWFNASQPLLYNRTLLNVPAANRTASSTFSSTTFLASMSTLNSTTAWISTAATYLSPKPSEWLKIDLGSVQTIAGIATKGRADVSPTAGIQYQTVTSFTVKVSEDNVNWTVLGLFHRSEDRLQISYADFDVPVSCRYIYVSPGDYVGGKSMRLDGSS